MDINDLTKGKTGNQSIAKRPDSIKQVDTQHHMTPGQQRPLRIQQSTNSHGHEKASRSRTGCLTCRARKIKCDERQDGCHNCERIRVACPGYTLKPLHHSERARLKSQNSTAITEAGVRRSRLARSCKACQLAKTRCSGMNPKCSRCTDKLLSCTYETVSRHEQNRSTLSNHHASRREPSALPNGSLSWLASPSFPTREKVRYLVEAYFTNIHPIRCFGFIHKPSLMEKLDTGTITESHNSALLYVVCALDYLDDPEGLDVVQFVLVGSGWASKAQSLLASNLNDISIENLMAAVLLHDYHLRVGDYMAAFMISGLTTRMVQALQINLEFSTDILCSMSSSPLDVTIRESRRRLMWSCFVMDSWVGSGVDQLTLLDKRDIKIQLPCNEQDFIQQTPCITENMENVEVTRFLPERPRHVNAAVNMGLSAYFIRITELRKKVLRFVKVVDISKPSQLPNAEFAAFDAAFKQWKDSLPSKFELNSRNVYIQKESNQLAAFFLLHCVYHVTICDLYRVGDPRLLPSLPRHRLPTQLSAQHQEFFASCQKVCFEHAKEVAFILGRAVEHGQKTLSDTWLPTITFESSRIMLYQITRDTDKDTNLQRPALEEVLPLFKSNLEALKLMIPLFAMAKSCYLGAISLLHQAGLGPHLREEGIVDTTDSATGINLRGTSIRDVNSHVTPESVLNPLAIYNLARKNLKEKHLPEEVPVASSANLVSEQASCPTTSSSAIAQHDRNTSNTTAELLPQCNTQVTPTFTEPGLGMHVDLTPWDHWSMGFGNNAFDTMPYFGGMWPEAETVQEGIGASGFWTAPDPNMTLGNS